MNICCSRRKFYIGRENSVRWHREFAYRRHVSGNRLANRKKHLMNYSREFLINLLNLVLLTIATLAIYYLVHALFRIDSKDFVKTVIFVSLIASLFIGVANSLILTILDAVVKNDKINKYLSFIPTILITVFVFITFRKDGMLTVYSVSLILFLTNVLRLRRKVKFNSDNR